MNKRKDYKFVESNDKDNFTDDGRLVPNHYLKGQYETICVLEDQLSSTEMVGLCKGLIIKYITKDTTDLLRNWKKANYYIKEAISILSKENKLDEDRVNPKYFKQHELEPIDIIEDQMDIEEVNGFYKGIVLKYICRASHKYGLEDLAKAGYYIDRFVKRLEEDK